MYRRLSITYELSADSGVLVGSTADVLGVGIDKATIRRRRIVRRGELDPESRPLIPGSALKGKIRNECERILAALGREVCRAPRADTMCPHEVGVKNPPCPVCQLFGGPSHPAKLFFGDAIAKLEPGAAPYAVRIQAGVALSRKRRAAEDDRLYYVGRGIEGLVYEGRIEGYLDDAFARPQIALLVAAIERLVAIGGGKSRGAGWVRGQAAIALDEQPVTGEQLKQIREEGWQAWRESK